MATVHVVAVPVQAPDQPVKVEPLDALAVKVTLLAVVKLARHDEPQLMPVGELVTVPLPVPAFVTASVLVVRAKVAVTDFAAVMLTVQVVAVPVQPPDQLENAELAAGAAMSVTLVPEA